jgi:hypothetical protein
METLARNTITNYRSRLKRLKEVLNVLTSDERLKAEVEIAQLELKLGPQAQAIRKPGRPKIKVDIPEDATRDPGKMADNPWSEEAIRERKKAKLALLRAKTLELTGELEQLGEVKSEFDKANEVIQEAIREEAAKKAIEGGERADGRTSEEGKRGTSEERKTG